MDENAKNDKKFQKNKKSSIQKESSQSDSVMIKSGNKPLNQIMKQGMIPSQPGKSQNSEMIGIAFDKDGILTKNGFPLDYENNKLNTEQCLEIVARRREDRSKVETIFMPPLLSEKTKPQADRTFRRLVEDISPAVGTVAISKIERLHEQVTSEKTFRLNSMKDIPKVCCGFCDTEYFPFLGSKCGHILCANCWTTHLKKSLECPLCFEFTREDLLVKIVKE